MNDKGFSLVTVLILSLVIFLIGGTGLYIASTSFKATRADIHFNIAEKASNSGLLGAFDYINMTGGGESLLENSSYKYEIASGGKNVWFVRSAGSVKNSSAKVVKTAMFQGYSGVGLYTVRGNVDANIDGSVMRLSGCDAAPDPDCHVPAFIASGTINIKNAEGQACTADGATDGTSPGLYGAPARININQGDLSRIFFKVKCFNKYENSDCTVSLLDYLEYDYGWNRKGTVSTADDQQDFSFQQNDQKVNGVDVPGNGTGIPVITLSDLPHLPTNLDSKCEISTGSTLNLAAVNVATCKQIVLKTSLEISGSGDRNGSRVEIYSYDYDQTFNNTAKNFAFYAKKTFTSNGASDFSIKSSGVSIIKDGTRGFELYTSGLISLYGTVGTVSNPFRIVSTNTITAEAGNVFLVNGTLITGPASIVDTDSITAPQNLVAASGNTSLTIDNVSIFARRLGFANDSTVKILNSLVYVYAYACPNKCTRTTLHATIDSSIKACDKNPEWCGWYGSEVNLNIGRDLDGTAKPVLFISNNTTVRMDAPKDISYTWGVWYGEDVTLLRWYDLNSWNLSGFLIRNYPVDKSTLNIKLTSKNKMNFSKSIIDAISNRYRFLRQVECVRDPLTPKAQLIQTRMTNY